MQNIQSKIASQNWESITESMHENGFAIIPNFLNNEQCEDLKTVTPTQLYTEKRF